MGVAGYGLIAVMGIATFFLLFGVLFWRIGAAIFRAFMQFFLVLWRNKGLTGVLLLLLGIGIPLQVFQEEFQTAADISVSCFWYPPLEITNSFFSTMFRDPYRRVAVGWNDGILLLSDGVVDLIDEVSSLVRVGNVVSRSAGLSSIVGVLSGNFVEDLGEIVNIIFGVIISLINGVIDVLLCLWDWFATVLTRIFFDRTIFSLSCSFCAFDPIPKCPLRETPFGGADDCDNCFDIVPELFGCFGSAIDTLILDFSPEVEENVQFRRIFRAVGCVLRSLYSAPVYLLSALVSPPIAGGDPPCLNAVEIVDITDEKSLISQWFIGGDFNKFDCNTTDSQICCGKPTACLLPIYGGEDLPVGFIPCLGELLAAITNDRITDFLKTVFAFLLAVINDIINSFKSLVEAFDDGAHPSTLSITDCFERWPDDGLVPVEDGECKYDLNQNGVDKFTPTGGIFQCFQIAFNRIDSDVQLGKAPFLGPILPILDFLFGGFWQFGLDFAVCPFVTFAQCASNPYTPALTCFSTDFQGTICYLECLRDESPVFGPIAKFLIPMFDFIRGVLSTINATISAIKGFFAQLGATIICLLKCSGDSLGEFFECFSGSCCSGNQGCEGNIFPPDEVIGSADAYLRQLGSTRSAPDEATISGWNAELMNHWHVPRNSFCGSVLYNTPGTHPPIDNMGGYMTYMACVTTYGMRCSLAERCAGQKPPTDSWITEMGTWAMSCPPGALRAGANASTTPPQAFDETFFGTSLSTTTNHTAQFEDLSKWITGVGVAVRNISIMPDILRPIWENFKTTSIYGRGSEFLTVYQERSSKDNSTKDDLEQMYVDFTNDVMRFYHTGLWRNESLDDVHVSLDAVPGQPVPVSSYTTRFGELRYDATLEEMRALPDQVWAAAAANGVMRAADDTLNIAVAGERAASPTAQTAYQRASPDARALWDEMTRRIGLEYWPTVQAFSGMSNAVKNKNGSMVLGILTGRMKYSVSRGKFLTRTQFLSEAKARDYFAANARPSIISAMLGQSGSLHSHLRQERRKFSPFPIPADSVCTAALANEDAARANLTAMEASSTSTNTSLGRARDALETATHAVPIGCARELFPWARSAAAVVSRMHTDTQARRQLARARGESPVYRHRDEADFSANDILFEMMDRMVAHSENVWDWTAGMIGLKRPKVQSVTKAVEDQIRRWDEYLKLPSDDPDHYSGSIEQFFLDWFKCDVPENIDGTSAYSGFCLMLLPEFLLDAFVDFNDTEAVVQPQIAWPEELIDRQCRTVYSGNPRLGPDFAFSDNCALPLPQLPLLSSCLSTAHCLNSTIIRGNPSLSSNRTTVVYTFIEEMSTCDVDFFVIGMPVCATTPPTPVNVVSVIGDPESCVSGFEESTTDGGCANAGAFRHLRVNLTQSSSCSVTVTFDQSLIYGDASGTTVSLGSEEEGDQCLICGALAPLSCAAAGDELVDPFRMFRPLCDEGCDYCERTFLSCTEAGFGDFLDTTAWLIAVIPRFLNSLFFGGIDFFFLESIYFTALGLPLVIASVLACCCGCGTLIIPFVLQINVAGLITWTIFSVFGPVFPFALFYLALIGLILKFAGTIDKVVKIIIATLAFFVFIWLLDLVFEFSTDIAGFDPVQLLINALLVFDDQFFLWFINWDAFISRLEPFAIPIGQPLPDVATFCGIWSLANLAITGFVLLAFPFFIVAIGLVLLAIVLFIVGTLLLITGSRRKALQVGLLAQAKIRRRQDGIQDSKLGKMNRAIEDLFARGGAKLAARFDVEMPRGRRARATSDDESDRRQSSRTRSQQRDDTAQGDLDEARGFTTQSARARKRSASSRTTASASGAGAGAGAGADDARDQDVGDDRDARTVRRSHRRSAGTGKSD